MLARGSSKVEPIDPSEHGHLWAGPFPKPGHIEVKVEPGTGDSGCSRRERLLNFGRVSRHVLQTRMESSASSNSGTVIRLSTSKWVSSPRQ